MFQLAVPVLHVSQAAHSEEFYCSKLGFTRQFAYRVTADPDPCYMGLKRDGVWLHVSSFPGDGVAGGVVNFYVDDVDAVHEELLNNGVEIALPPTHQDWNSREMHVRDPDGNKLRFICDH